MYLTAIVLNNEQDLNLVLEKFNEISAIGATILESSGLGRKRFGEAFFGSLRKMLFEKGLFPNKTLFVVVDSKEQAEVIIEETEKVIGNFNEQGTGIAFAFPLVMCKGTLKNDLNSLGEGQ